jgi:hypothetical protein
LFLLCWLFRFGGIGGGSVDLKLKSISLLNRTEPDKTSKTYLFMGNGGFGGGLESRNILSVLCDVRTGICDVFSKISRSLQQKKNVIFKNARLQKKTKTLTVALAGCPVRMFVGQLHR